MAIWGPTTKLIPANISGYVVVCIIISSIALLVCIPSNALQIRVPTGLSVRIKSRDVIVEFQKQVS